MGAQEKGIPTIATTTIAMLGHGTPSGNPRPRLPRDGTAATPEIQLVRANPTYRPRAARSGSAGAGRAGIMPIGGGGKCG